MLDDTDFLLNRIWITPCSFVQCFKPSDRDQHKFVILFNFYICLKIFLPWMLILVPLAHNFVLNKEQITHEQVSIIYVPLKEYSPSIYMYFVLSGGS